MQFEHEGRLYDTASMIQFETGAGYEPLIYVLPAERRAFVVRVDHWQGVIVQAGTERDIERWAELYRLPGLLNAFKDGAEHRKMGEEGEGENPSPETPAANQ